MTLPADIRPIRQGTDLEWTELRTGDYGIQCKGRWQEVEGQLRDWAKERTNG